MNRSESKYFNTARLMDEALLCLLEDKDFVYITVKELCETAGVNRSTFYLHYETMGDLLTECMDYVNDKFIRSVGVGNENFPSTIGTAPLEDLVLVRSKFLRPYLEFIKVNKTIFVAALKNPDTMESYQRNESLLKYILYPIMTRFSIPEKEQPYWAAFFMSGCVAIITKWIEGGLKESAQEIEEIILRCIRPGEGSYK